MVALMLHSVRYGKENSETKTNVGVNILALNI